MCTLIIVVEARGCNAGSIAYHSIPVCDWKMARGGQSTGACSGLPEPYNFGELLL